MTRTNIIKIEELKNGKYTRNSKNTTSKPFFHSYTNRERYVGTAAYVSNDYYNHDGGGGMDNYITRPEFEEHRRHLDTRFDGVSKDIDIAKEEVINKVEATRKSDKRWFIGLIVPTLLTVIGMALKVFGII